MSGAAMTAALLLAGAPTSDSPTRPPVPAVSHSSAARTSAVLAGPHRPEPPDTAAAGVGRGNPFAAPARATAVQTTSGQKASTQKPLDPGASARALLNARVPMSAAMRHGDSSLGIDLPMPPGFVGRSGSEPPAVPHVPGDGMKVGAIIGGTDRVAIIDDHGSIATVGVGDRIGDAVVARILVDRVILRRGTQTFELHFEGAAP